MAEQKVGPTSNCTISVDRNVRFGSKADMCSALAHVRADMCSARGMEMSAKGPKRTFDRLLDHLVGVQQERFWDRKSECFGSFNVDYPLEFCRLLNRKIRRSRALQNLVGV